MQAERSLSRARPGGLVNTGCGFQSGPVRRMASLSQVVGTSM